MSSIISHPAVPLAIGLGLGSGIISRRLLAAGVVASMAPDLDVYAEMVTTAIGHRGHTHTLLFAAMCGAGAALIAPVLHATRSIAFLFVFLATASHPLLDAFTNGGVGIPFFLPFHDARYFMPVTPIEVAPLGVRSFFSMRGVEVLWSELKWVWLPCAALAGALYAVRRWAPR